MRRTNNGGGGGSNCSRYIPGEALISFTPAHFHPHQHHLLLPLPPLPPPLLLQAGPHASELHKEMFWPISWLQKLQRFEYDVLEARPYGRELLRNGVWPDK